MTEQEQDPTPDNAGAGPADQGHRPEQTMNLAESESLAPDYTLLDPASTAVAS
jgi:hypothetical protein